jgi:hypothetical protein
MWRIKMTDTMKTMELIHADNLTPDQLMEGDLIKINDDIVEVIGIDSDATGSVYAVEHQNEFGEREIAEYDFNDSIPLYVFIDEDEE